jgi:SAM-dependent methyltransferase
MTTALKRLVYQTVLWHRYFKNRTELGHWSQTLERIVKWHLGEEAYVFPFPTGAEKETRYSVTKNALMTFIAAENRHASYLHDLKLRANSFAGLKVADIGSGPLPTLAVFEGCDRYCIDHLIDVYRMIGYPIEEFEKEMHFINAKSEQIPLENGFFDVVISRNALDHVDDFEKTALEIRRILKPGGLLHILVNYHSPTSSEPQTLSDERILNCFGSLNIRKVLEEKDAWGFSGGKTVLWSNVPSSRMAPLNSIPATTEVPARLAVA